MLSKPGFCYVIRAWIGLNFHWFHQNSCLILRWFCDLSRIYRHFHDFLRYTDIFCVVSEVSLHICVISEVSRHKSTDVDAEFDEEQRWNFRDTSANKSVPNAKAWIWITELLRKNLWEYAQRQKLNQDTILNLKNRWICTKAGSENVSWHKILPRNREDFLLQCPWSYIRLRRVILLCSYIWLRQVIFASRVLERRI